MVAPKLGQLLSVTLGLAVSIGLVVGPAPTASALVSFGGEAVTPESANTARFGIEQQGKQLSDSGAHAEAAELYWREGVRLKDPVLLVDSAEALIDQAEAERAIDPAKAAIERVAPALDMLYFLRDGATSSAWQPIAPENLDVVITRAEAVITDANAEIAEIEQEQRKAEEAAAAAAAAAVEPEKRSAKPGTGLLAAGSALVVVGLGGAGLGAAGLVLGGQAQADVEDPLVYEPEHSEAASRGKTANVLAGVGFAIAGVGLGAGVALLVVGAKQRKRAGAGPAAEASLVPVWLGDGGGLGLAGRF